MRRVISLFLPTWPTDRYRRRRDCAVPRDEPLVTSARDGQRRIVCAVDPAARALGLQPGMPLAEARARITDLHVIDTDPAADNAALARLAAWCLRYSPMVAPDPPNGIWIDATGCAHLFGGEQAMLEDLVDRCRRASVAAHAAIADAAGAAHGIARYGRRAVVVTPLKATSGTIERLPLEALRLSPEATDGLRQLGFETIGDLERTARAPLTRRFGLDVVRRLDQAHGRLPEPLEPITPPELVRVSRPFLEPLVTASPLQHAISALVETLCQRLEARHLGARQVDLLFHRVDGAVQAIRIGTVRPSRNTTLLARLLVDRLESVDPGFGIERMTLVASLAEPVDWSQAGLDASTTQHDVSGLIDVLTNRLGTDRLYRAAPVESDLPERSVRAVPPLAPPTGVTWPDALPRPIRLLKPPETIETLALLPDHPPVHF
ncbi:DNA polymerase Y family protein, partial [Vineibacter terrae]|uniref:Y-family DNA polymerase n=1 Tax=Vineibacter terrae TaxID=2586908 RepID=UPI002E3560A4